MGTVIYLRDSYVVPGEFLSPQEWTPHCRINGLVIYEMATTLYEQHGMLK